MSSVFSPYLMILDLLIFLCVKSLDAACFKLCSSTSDECCVTAAASKATLMSLTITETRHRKGDPLGQCRTIWALFVAFNVFKFLSTEWVESVHFALVIYLSANFPSYFNILTRQRLRNESEKYHLKEVQINDELLRLWLGLDI